ncbi:hypothetical protein HRbin40_02274 [bacterium HR40]|nr:hypothetical protein HRbin40_02274 [bacterium HR40]
MHRICHRKLHSLFSERELAGAFSDLERLRAHPDIRRFVDWVRRRPPEFDAPTAPARSKRRGRHPRRC